MLSLSPAKLLVVLVIALIVLGPDKLPQVARQIGAAWHDLRDWRSRIES
jgi:TatA/E family protein of Tat protein translocase